MEWTASRARVAIVVLSVAASALAVSAADAALRARLQSMEQTIESDPENLALAAAYRAVVVETGQYDRAIDFLEKLAKRRGSGPNVQISLALAYVDKVPPSGDIRRLYLGRDAMGALTRAIALRPTTLAYYLRGRINLYYNRFIFKRTDKGIADLERALAMISDDTPAALVVQIYTSLGDGYYKIGNAQKAREVWSTADAKYPGDAGLRRRLEKQGQELEWTVGQALAAERRADTSLSGFLPAHQ